MLWARQASMSASASWRQASTRNALRTHRGVAHLQVEDLLGPERPVLLGPAVEPDRFQSGADDWFG